MKKVTKIKNNKNNNLKLNELDTVAGGINLGGSLKTVTKPFKDVELFDSNEVRLRAEAWDREGWGIKNNKNTT